jgi:two-component system nitrogen regulation response regulator GlnG
VNNSDITPSTAASELFGHAAGAFTGAVRARDGFFVEAHGGTLFLDEIAEVPAEVQAMLLRVLETREVQALGSNRTQKVDLRLLAATDADLEELIASGRFREPLFHRIAGYQLQVPPLRERRDDVGRLLQRFLGEEMAAVGELQKLERPLSAGDPWLPADVVGRLARHDWPGNVRQLKNVVRQLVISSRGLEQARLDSTLEKLLADLPGRPEAAEPTAPAPREAVAPQELTDDRVLEALRKNAWKTTATAEELGISRTTLYALIDRSGRIRKARDVPRDELLACLEACGGDVTAAAAKLEVSKRGLQLRLAEDGG